MKKILRTQKANKEQGSDKETANVKVTSILSDQAQPIIDKAIKNPQIFIAMVIGTIPGIFIGGIFGGYIGILASYKWQIDIKGLVLPLNIPNEFAFFILSGIAVGIVIGGGISGLFTTLKAFLRSDPYLAISSKNLHEIMLGYLSFSLRISLVLAVGATLGTLRDPGLGTFVGAAAATLLYAVLERSNLKLVIH